MLILVVVEELWNPNRGANTKILKRAMGRCEESKGTSFNGLEKEWIAYQPEKPGMEKLGAVESLCFIQLCA